MKFDGAPKLNITKKEEKAEPQKLDDMLPFLKISQDQINHNKQLKAGNELFLSGKFNEAIEAAKDLKEGGFKKKEFTEDEFEKFSEARENLATQLGYTVTVNEGKWFNIENENCWVSMKHSMTPIFNGYKGGRISEIAIVDKENKKNLIEFIGSNVIGLKNEELKKYFDEIIKYFN